MAVFRTEADVYSALLKRYQQPEWFLIGQVRNQTGISARRRERYMDALAMNMYPSRGLAIHGFEIKVDRADWLREMRDPQKADDLARFCDYWWLVVGSKDIVRDDELPKGWGLLLPRGKGLVAKVTAQERQAQNTDRVFLASVLRTFDNMYVPKSVIRPHLNKRYEEGLQDGKKSAKWEMQGVERDHKTLLERLKTFKEASGIDLLDSSYSWRMDKVGEAVRLITVKGVDEVKATIRGMRNTARNLLNTLEKYSKEFDERGDNKELENEVFDSQSICPSPDRMRS